MNAELSRIRNNRDLSDKFDHAPDELKDSKISRVIELNTNMAVLYSNHYHNEIDINEFANNFIANIYIVLTLFNDMGVYPDYFYNEIVKMNVEYRKLVNDNSIRGKYILLEKIGLEAETISAIREGMKRGYYRVQAMPKRDIGESYDEMGKLFDDFGIQHGICTKEQCAKTFNDINYNLSVIMSQLINSDDIYDEIECLSRLLFDYLTFFVSLGINPKEYLDNYIDEKEMEAKQL